MLGITRSSVAVHIANLQKKGCLLGRGYIVNEGNYVVGIGAANVDDAWQVEKGHQSA